MKGIMRYLLFSGQLYKREIFKHTYIFFILLIYKKLIYFGAQN